MVMARVGEIQEAIFEEKSSGFFLHKKKSFPSKSIQNRIIFGSPIRKPYIDWEMMTFPGSLYWLTPWESSVYRYSTQIFPAPKHPATSTALRNSHFWCKGQNSTFEIRLDFRVFAWLNRKIENPTLRAQRKISIGNSSLIEINKVT